MTNRRRYKNSAGFTIVELMIVVAIIVILLGVSFLALLHHQKNVKQLELDTVAKEIFVAAQNHLTAAESQGLTEQLAAGGAGRYGSPAGKTGEYYVVVGNSWDSGDSEGILGLMLPFASVDETVRTGGSYVIHYNKDGNQILNVFYTRPKGDRFAYTLSGSDYNKLKDLTGASKKKARRSYNDGKSIVGWYGAEGGGALAVGAALQQPKVTVSNAERLTVAVDDTANASNADNAIRILELIVEGETSGALREIFLKHPDASKMASNSHWDIKNDGNKYTLVFDDVTVSKKHFNDLFNDTPDGKFIPGENLIIYARTSYSEKIGMATGAKKKTNSLFATGRVSGSNYQVTIANFRHLENLSEDISSYASFKGSKSGQKTTAAIQARDLSWKSFRKVMAKIKGTGKPIHVYNRSDVQTADGTYASLTVTGYTLEYSGHGKKITDVVIDETGVHEGTARDSSGLIGEMKGGILSMVRLRNFSVASNGSAGALAGSLDGTKVTECVAYNSKKAERKEIKVWNAAGTDLSSMNKLEVSGKGNVGGLIGVIGGSEARVEKSAAALYVKSTTTAGGLIGKVDGAVTIQYSYAGGHTKEGAYITSTGDGSYAYTPPATETVDTKGVQGRVNVNAGPTGTAGGLIGSGKSAALDKCYTTCSVFGKAGADTANNLIGDKNVNKIDGCYGAGVVYKEETAADSTKFLSVAGEKSDDTLELEKTPAAPAFPYDPLLFSSYKGRYGYKSMQQLASLTATESTALPDFMMSHYGDWAAPAVKAQLEVINEEVLHARIKIPVGKDTIETPMDIKLTVSVGAVGETDPEKRKVFTVRTSSDTDVNGTALSNTEKIDPYKLGNVHRYDDGAFVYYDVVLDDITEAGTRFASLFKYLDDAAPTAEKKKTKPNIFYPGVEITEVIADIGGGTTVLSTQDDEFQDLEGRAKENRKWNSLYANGSLRGGEDGFGASVAGIKNFRHLENLDKRISARDGKNEDNADYTKLAITKAKQQGNLVWRKTNPGGEENGEEDGGVAFQEALLAIKRNWVVKHAAAKEDPCPAMDPDATKAAAKAAAITNGKFSVYADGLKDPSGSEATVTGIQPYGEINGEKFNSYMPVNWSLKDDGEFTYDASSQIITNLYVRSPLKESIPSIPDSYQTDQHIGTIEKNPDTYKADAGLFGYVTTSNASGKTFKVQNLTMKNAEVLHGSSCGSVIGRVNTIASKDPGSTAADAAGTVLLDKIHVDGDYTHIVGIMLLNSSKKMVYARGYAGGLIGSAGDADIQIQDSHIKGKYAFVHSDALDSYGGTFAKSQTNLGGGCSGGLIASMQWCKMKIANCFCSAYVYGEYGDCNAGIIGRTYGNYKYSGGENSYIKNCYVAGRTRNATFQQGAFNWDQKAEVASTITGFHTTGGLIGYCNVLGGFDVRDCFSMASLFSTNEDVEEGKGSLGGLIGKINGNIRLSGCYAGGRIYAPDKYVGEQKGAAGTFVGVSTSNMNNIQGNMVLGGINYRVTRMIGDAPAAFDPTDATKIKTVFVSDDSANDIQVASGSRIAAERYDQTLPDSYPFLPLGQSKYCGDWEKPNAQDASYELKWTVENKDKLTASFDIPQERINDRCWITLLVKGKTSNKKCLAPIWIRYKDGTVTASVEKPKSVIDGFDDTQTDLGTIKAGTGSFKSEEKAGKVTVTFVMDDITKESGHFAQHFPSLYQGENIAIYSVAGLKDLTKDGALSDVKEYASGSGEDERTLTNDVDKVGKIDTNSLFGNSTTVSGDDEDGSGNVAIIRWTRHLQNLDPLVSGINHVGSSGTGKGLAFAKAAQKKDIYWKDDDKSFRHNVGADKTITPFSTTYNTVKLPDAEYFYGIRNERLKEYDAENNRLLKFTMKGGSENNISNFVKNDSPESGGDNKPYYDKANMAGLFRAATTDLTIKNLKVENFDCQASESVNYSSAGTIIGQAGEANNKSKHDMTLQLKDITVNGTKVYATKYHAGGLIGSIDNNKNSVKTRDITISDITYAGTIDVKTDTANENNAGGLTGYVQDADLKVTNVKSDGTLKVESKKFAGGLVGLMEGKQQFKADGVNISGTYEVKSTAYATGGVAGRIQGVSTIDVDNVNLKGFNGSAKTNIGSLFGVISGTATATTATNAMLDNVEVDGLTMNTVDKSAGGVIGSTEGSFASLKAKTVTVKGSGTIRSTEDAGGFAGHLAGMSGDNTQTNETVIEGFTLNLNAQDGTTNYQIRSDAGSGGGVIGTVGKRDGNVNNQQRINVFKVIKPKLTSPSIYGKKFAGGLIGVFNGNTNREAEISLDGQSDATNISDLVVEADTEDAGGLIAKIDTYYTRLAINKIHIDKLLRVKSNAKSAGGFIADLCTNKQGDSCGAAITDCNIEAAEDMDKGIVLATQEDGEVQYKAAGGILGRVQPNSDLQMNRVRVVNAKVMGMKRTGGILGNLDNNFRTFNAGNVRFYGRNACVCSKKLQVGGFAGYIGNGGTVNIKISCAGAYVMTTGSHTGGFIGDLLAKGEITESYAGGHTFLDGNNAVYREGPALNYTPGVGVAFNKDAQDQEMRGGYNVYNASQNGGGNLGGFIGSVTGAVTFKKCFATTSVFSALAQKPGSNQKLGGLCGNIYNDSANKVQCKFEDCYAAGKVFDVAASVTGNANIAPFCAEKNKNGGDDKSVRSYYLGSIMTDAMYARLDAVANQQERFYFNAVRLSYEKLSGATDDSPFKNSEALGATANRFDGATVPNNQYAFPFYPTGAETRTFHGDWAAAIPPVTNSLQTMQHMAPMTAPLAAPGEPQPAAGDNTAPGGDPSAAGGPAPEGGQPSSEGGEPAPAAVPEAAPEPVP